MRALGTPHDQVGRNHAARSALSSSERLMHGGEREASHAGRGPAQGRLQARRSSAMPRILIIQPCHERGMAFLQARDDIEFEIVDGTSEAELATKIRDADAATIRTVPLPAAVIDQAERLK